MTIRPRHWMAPCALALLPLWAHAQVSTQTATNGPNFQDIHWLAFDAATATAMFAGNVNFSAPVTLPGGNASLEGSALGTIAVTSGNATPLVPVTAPVWASGANQTAFGAPNNYQGLGAVALAATVTPDTKYRGSKSVQLSNLKLVGPDARNWSFQMVLADAESTDQPGSESFSGTTDGATWQQVADMVPTPASTNAPTLAAPLSTSFEYVGAGGTGLAHGLVLSTQNPTSVAGAIKAGTPGNIPTAQAIAFGVWPLVPSVTVTCNQSTPAQASETCTVTVTNAPQSPMTLQLNPIPGADPASSCFQPMTVAAGQVAAQTLNCTVQMPPNTTGQVTNAPAEVSQVAGWTTAFGTVSLESTATPPQPPVAPQPVPVDSPWALLLGALGMAGWLARKRA